ncbi:MAG: ferritin-like domain-containing protein [Methylophaga sp.]|nr:ferritin-like domain-containing protein [Methylophaga sp.]
MDDLRELALRCLLINDPLEKVQQTQALYQRLLAGKLETSDNAFSVPDEPGRPDKPALVAPRDLPRRRNSAETGNASLIHAVCHIEFNAINLGLDAVARFSGLPQQYYTDWARVAFEESQHFMLLRNHLNSLGYDYGDFPAHNGMWEMARKTHHDPLIRMALVPRVLEARGLDVTPKMMNKLRGSGDLRAVEILEIILEEEIGHVKVGTRWFNYLCEQRKVDPLATFKDLLDNYFSGELRGPFNSEARKLAGFTDEEMALLEGR